MRRSLAISSFSCSISLSRDRSVRVAKRSGLLIREVQGRRDQEASHEKQPCAKYASNKLCTKHEYKKSRRGFHPDAMRIDQVRSELPLSVNQSVDYGIHKLVRQIYHGSDSAQPAEPAPTEHCCKPALMRHNEENQVQIQYNSAIQVRPCNVLSLAKLIPIFSDSARPLLSWWKTSTLASRFA